MTPIIETVAANGLAFLAGQVSKKLNHKYSLLMRMRRDLKGTDLKDSENILLDTLQRALDNYDILSQATNHTLLDIANSGLLDQLISLIGSDLDHTDAKQLISYIHLSRGSGDQSASIQFSEDLVTCLQTAYNTYHSAAFEHFSPLSKRNHQRALADAAKKAGSLISSLVNSLRDKEGNWLEGQDVSADYIAKSINHHLNPLIRYVNSTIQRLNSVDVHGASGDVVQATLDEIYVDVPVSFIPRQGNFVNYQDLRRHLRRDEIANNWQDTLEHVSKTVLLGDPGGGKSTLSKKLCYECAKKFLIGHSALPIFIQLRTYIAQAVDDEGLSLTQYILKHVRSTITDPDDDPLETTVLYYLRIGSVFVVADGLDEVLTTSNRARVVQEIQKFSTEFPLATLLVTSRYVGYENHPLKGFRHLGVDHLHDDAIEAIYQNVSRFVLQKSPFEIQNKKIAFLTDAHRKAKELIQNPLLLSLIVIIYNKKSEIPDNRASLYSFCADLLFDRWDGFRDITPELPERFRLFDLFKYLSSILYEREEYGGRINKEDLLEEAREFFRRDYIDNREGKSAAAAYHMVEHLTGRAWILHEVGENVFEFTHRTFMEFFYARHLETEFESTDELVQECLKHVTVGSRTVPAHLALQIRTKDKRRASSTICKALNQAFKDSEGSAELVDFSLDALGYLLPDGANISALAATLAPRVFASEKSADPIRLLCTTNPLRNTILHSALLPLKNIRSVDAVHKLVPALLRLHREENDSVELEDGDTVSIIGLIIDQTYSKQATSPFLCKLAFDLDAKTNWDALARFGFRIWFNTHSHGFVQIANDSRKLVKEASKFVTGLGNRNNKYIRLAQLLSRNIGTNRQIALLDGGVILPIRHVRRSIAVDVCVDPHGWRNDRPALEVFAFCLTLFLEMHFEVSTCEDLAKYRKTFVDLIEILEELDSPQAAWFRSWMADEATLVVDSRYVNRRMRNFLVE